MNARIPAPAIPPWSPELERNCLGLAMLAHPVPAWLEPEHFFPSQHQLIFRAVKALSKRTTDKMLPRVAKLLRSKGWLYQAGVSGLDRHSRQGMLSSVDLGEMALEADHALRMGWAIDFEQLRELAEARRLLETMGRCVIRLRAGEMTAAEAREQIR